MFRRVGICDTDYIGFLIQLVGFPDFFIDYTDHGVACVSFKTLVNVLDEARVLAPEFVSCGVDYATRERSPYATINAIMQGFVRDGCCEMMGQIVRASQEVFDMVLADAVFRQD